MLSQNMKAILWQGGKRFELGEVPVPRPGRDQVLLQVEAASICATDFHYDDFECEPPIIPGHEVAGSVVGLGTNVQNVQIGQKVTVDPVQRCGSCELCSSGISHMCVNTRHLGYSDAPGGWAEYVAVDVANVYPIPDNVSLLEAALTEPAAVCMESFNRAGFEPGQDVLVLGDGVFGFIHGMLAQIFGARRIVVAGHYNERLNRIAEKTGAATCNTHATRLEDVLGKTVGGLGVHLAIEATGSGAAPNIGLRALRPRGTLVLFSYIWHPEMLDLALVNMKELNVLGACRSLDCFGKCLRLMAEGKLDLGTLVDIKIPLEQYDKAMTELRENKANLFKAVLLPQKQPPTVSAR